MTNVVVTALSALTLAGSWMSEAPELYPVGNYENRLQIAFNGCNTNGVKRVLLKEPVAVPEGCDFYFKAMRPWFQSVRFRTLVRDAQGREFAVRTTGAYHLKHSNMFGGQFRPDIVMMASGEWRVKSRLSEVTKENAVPVQKVHFPVKYPLELIGFDILPEQKAPVKDQCVWLRDFKFSNVNAENTKFFYTFMGEQRFGELDGDPVFSGLDVQGARLHGPQHKLEWELRDQFDGAPFLQGERMCEIPNWNDKKLRRPIGFDIPLETFRVREEGSYWLNLKWSVNWRNVGKTNAAPDKTFTWTIRYDVFKGEPPKKHKPIAAEKLNSAAKDRLAAQAKIRANAVNGAKPFKAPPLASGEDIRVGNKSLVIFNPMVHSVAKSVEHYTQLMDEMLKHGLKREIEISVTWPMMEPLPGVYDFKMLDDILDAAAERGIGCFVTFGTLVPPAWMPSWFTQNEEGKLFGHTIYLFNGGRFNVCHHPQGRKHATDFAAALCDHVKGHPALIGYFYLVEHGGDSSWSNWYEGYDVHTRANFRKWLAEKYPDVARLNANWGTKFASFAAVEPPRQKHPRPEDTPARLRDWRDFKAYSLEKLQWDVIKCFRDRDPYRSIMIYGSPTLGKGMFDYSKIKVITANGGCAVPNRGYYMTAMAEAGMPQRAEEISCSNWKAWGPYQLDVSLFNMLQGGGLMTHFKMFTPQGIKFDNEKFRDANGFGNFVKFVPIEEEVRGAVRLDDDLAGWTSSRGADYGEWCYEMVQNAQLFLGTSVTPSWKKAKAVFVSEKEKGLYAKEIGELEEYVRNGGHLYFPWHVGCVVFDRPAETNALLKAFGISAPEKVWHKDWYFEATVMPDSPWWSRAGGSETAYKTRMRSPVKACADAGEAMMRMEKYDNTPALTRKPWGKGCVYVLWGNHCIPYSRTDAAYLASKPFLAEIAKDAGAPSPVRCDRRNVFANLLKKGETYYLLTMSDRDMDAEAAVELDIPPEYRKAEDLVTGEKKELPLKLKMKKSQVQVWRITK